MKASTGDRERRPRVALVTLGAVDEFAVPRIVAHLVRRASDRVDFVVVSQRLAEDIRPRVDWRPVRIARWLPFRLRYPLFVALASLRVRRTAVDLVHSFGSHPLLLKPIDMATIQFLHTTHYAAAPEEDGRVVRALVTGLEHWCYRPGRVRLLAVPSVRARKEAERLFPGVDVTVVPNGVDPDRFRPDERARAAVRAQEGVGDDEVVAIFVGRAWHGKGLDIALESVALARARGAPLRLWIVGERDDEMARLADRLGLGGAVRFFGRRSDVESLLQGADIFLFPSLTETFGMACFEAAASGLPIVTTRVGGVEDLLLDTQAGLIVDRNPSAFGDALLRLAQDPPLRARMGAAARRRALDFGWDRAADELVSAYERLLATQGAPSSHV